MFKKNLPVLALPLASLLLVLSYPKFSQGWLAWFALAPLSFYILKSRTLKAAAAGGAACGFLFYLGILYWIYPTMRAGGVAPAVSALGLAALGLLLSSEFTLVSAYGFFMKRAGVKIWPYLFALGWFLLEYGKVYASRKALWFPWFLLGYTQWDYTPLIQIASVTGVYGLSAAVCFSGALAGSIFASARPWYTKALRFTPAVLVFSGLWLFGNAELKKAAAAVPARSFKAALLQPSIDLYAKWDETEAAGVRARIEALAASAKGAELVIWPENALPGWIEEPLYSGWLKSPVFRGPAGSIVGSVSKGDGRHVSAFLLDESGEIKAAYNKRQLVPFGEYVPFREQLGKYIEPVAALGEFLPGAPEQKLLDFGGTRIGTAICYESVFPYLFSEDTLRGAELFVNITNDGWYLDTAAPYQHFIVNIFRAVENRRTVVRAANNGISGVIDPWGRVLAKTELNARVVLAAEAPVYAERAFFPLYGHWFLRGACIAAAAFLLAVILV